MPGDFPSIPSVDRMQLTVWADDRPGLLAEVQDVLKIKQRNRGAETMERDRENASVVINSSLPFGITRLLKP